VGSVTEQHGSVRSCNPGLTPSLSHAVQSGTTDRNRFPQRYVNGFGTLISEHPGLPSYDHSRAIKA
jgi:hypothetical protein